MRKNKLVSCRYGKLKEKSYEKDIIVDDYLSAGYRGKCPGGGKRAYGEGVLHGNLQ